MPGLPHIVYSDLRRRLRRAGWIVEREGRRHIILVHPNHPGQIVPIPRHEAQIVKVCTLRRILELTGITVEDLEGLG